MVTGVIANAESCRSGPGDIEVIKQMKLGYVIKTNERKCGQRYNVSDVLKGS